MQPTIEAISSSRDGISDTALTPATVQCRLTHGTTKNDELVVVLGETLDDLGSCDGVFGIGRARSCPSGSSAMLAHGLPSRAILASLFLATRTDASTSRAFAHADPAFPQLSDRRSGLPQRRQSFRRSGRVPRPIFLSGLYPQFHSKFGGFPPAQFRLAMVCTRFGSNSGSRGQNHPRGRAPRRNFNSFPISGRNYARGSDPQEPSVSDRTGPFPAPPFAPAHHWTGGKFLF